jgi:hypothetical protein
MVLLAIAVGACGDPTHPTGAADMATVTDLTAATDLSSVDLTGICTTLSADAAPDVTPTHSTATAPDGRGGTLSRGTYFLTAATVFTEDPSIAAALSQPLREVIRFDGSTFEVIGRGTPAAETPLAGTYTTEDIFLTLQFTCGLSGRHWACPDFVDTSDMREDGVHGEEEAEKVHG